MTVSSNLIQSKDSNKFLTCDLAQFKMTLKGNFFKFSPVDNWKKTGIYY